MSMTHMDSKSFDKAFRKMVDVLYKFRFPFPVIFLFVINVPTDCIFWFSSMKRHLEFLFACYIQRTTQVKEWLGSHF